MEQLKHECGVALIRLKKPIEFYEQKYGTKKYALDKLYLLMEKQHNRGQEGAGMACVKLSAEAGEEFMFRERKEGKNAITDLFADIHEQMMAEKNFASRPFLGECYMGHLRYSTTGRKGLSYVHPMLRRQNYRENTFAMCGNFNLTNVNEIFEGLKATGQHPRRTSDTTVLLEQIGFEIDREPKGGRRLENILKRCVPTWDGGFVMCGLAGNGEMYAVRDPWGIRPAFYYEDEEILVVASERPVIQTVMNVSVDDVHELMAGEAIIVTEDCTTIVSQIVPQQSNSACSFERIYFSRGSDRDIYRERKKLGSELTPEILKAVNNDIAHSVYSFIPNTAEVAFWGMYEGLNEVLNVQKCNEIKALGKDIDPVELEKIIAERVRIEKVAIKDIKLRTFISETGERNELANHVYDITYGTITPNVDYLVAIDDSIVRGTTLRRSIITILSRLQPKKLVIVSSAPQIRYPDFYGIDMSTIEDLIAFRAAIELRGMDVVKEIYDKCIAQRGCAAVEMQNYVQELYAPLTNDDISKKIAELVTPKEVTCPVEIIYQTIDKLHEICPNNPGDWYFSGQYPTKGGVRLLNESFISFYENMNK